MEVAPTAGLSSGCDPCLGGEFRPGELLGAASSGIEGVCVSLCDGFGITGPPALAFGIHGEGGLGLAAGTASAAAALTGGASDFNASGALLETAGAWPVEKRAFVRSMAMLCLAPPAAVDPAPSSSVTVMLAVEVPAMAWLSRFAWAPGNAAASGEETDIFFKSRTTAGAFALATGLASSSAEALRNLVKSRATCEGPLSLGTAAPGSGAEVAVAAPPAPSSSSAKADKSNWTKVPLSLPSSEPTLLRTER
mmetsp:Transcript_13134/g.30702  ORF Transcript_13134/g.30702 Transcript_13134/m.30702 type:complete len:251 (-) Transcript_13134:130-882(-)